MKSPVQGEIEMPTRILRRPHVLDRIGASRATLYRWMEAGRFPRPVRLGPQAVGWREDEVDEWIESRERADRGSA